MSKNQDQIIDTALKVSLDITFYFSRIKAKKKLKTFIKDFLIKEVVLFKKTCFVLN